MEPRTVTRRTLSALLALAVALAPFPSMAAGVGTLMPDARRTFVDNNGAVCPGCLLFFYLAGTTTKQIAYSDSAVSVALSNPTTLDSSGRVAAGGPFLVAGQSYKFVLAPSTDTDPPGSPIWTQDNISAVPPASTASDNDVTGTAGENLAVGDAAYLSDGSGGQTAGRWYKANATNTYSSTLANTLGFATAAITTGSSGAIRIGGRITGLAGLVAGTLYYVATSAGTLTSTPPTNARPLAVADSATTAVVTAWVQNLDATATVRGYVNLSAQAFAGVKTFNSAPVFGGAATYNPGSDATADATISGMLLGSVDTTQHNNSGTGETTLSSYSLPANVLSVNGKTVRVTFWGTFAANGHTKTLKVKFGATSYTLVSSGVNGGGWEASMTITRTGATAQKGVAKGVAAANRAQTVVSSPTETLSGAITILTTGQSGTGSNDVTQEGFFVEVLG